MHNPNINCHNIIINNKVVSQHLMTHNLVGPISNLNRYLNHYLNHSSGQNN